MTLENDLPKTYICRGRALLHVPFDFFREHVLIKYALRKLFWLAVIVVVIGALYVPLTVLFDDEIANVTVVSLYIALVVGLGVSALFWRIMFTLYADRLEYNWLGVTERLLWDEAVIAFNPFNARAFLMRGANMWMSLAGLPQNMLTDFFSVLPPSVKVLLINVSGSTMGAIIVAKEDVYTKVALAAMSFHYLNDDRPIQALVARQMLINLTHRDPEYVPSSFTSDKIRLWKHWQIADLEAQNAVSANLIGQDAIKLAFKIREWQNWLANEFGEEIEAYAYRLEQLFVRQALYYIVLPGVLFATLGMFYPLEVLAFFIFVTALVCVCVLSSRFGLLIQYRRIARSVRGWRADFDRLNASMSERDGIDHSRNHK